MDQLGRIKVLPDICLLDINMPVLNGYDTMDQLHSRWPGLKVVALSMYDSEFSIIKMLRSGACGYFLKDADPDELHNALFHICENGFYHSELISNRIIGQLRHDAEEILALINLSQAELEFLKWVSSDFSIKEIAEQMNVKPRTLEKYSEVLFRKLHIKSRTGLAMFAIRIGIVPYWKTRQATPAENL